MLTFFAQNQAAMLQELKNDFSGELYYENNATHSATKMSYATDASEYQEEPLAVAIPKTIHDIEQLIRFAAVHISGHTALHEVITKHAKTMDWVKVIYFKTFA